jgi:hypothetical protein
MLKIKIFCKLKFTTKISLPVPPYFYFSVFPLSKGRRILIVSIMPLSEFRKGKQIGYTN